MRKKYLCRHNRNSVYFIWTLLCHFGSAQVSTSFKSRTAGSQCCLRAQVSLCHMGSDRLKCGNVQPLCQHLRKSPAPSRCTHRQWHCCGSTITRLSLFVKGNWKARVQARPRSHHWMEQRGLRLRWTGERHTGYVEKLYLPSFLWAGFSAGWRRPPGHNGEEPPPLPAWNKTPSSPFLPFSHHPTFLWIARFSAYFRVCPVSAGCGLR